MEDKTVVLCGASRYEEKYYFNPAFKSLPEDIRKELQIMCVLYTQEIGGVLILEPRKMISLMMRLAEL